MNCEQFERLIALQVEDDLPDAQQSKLSNHLSVCGSCHRFAEEIRDSQAALRGYTGEDFDETLLARIRQSVMSQIHNGEIALSRWEHIAGWFGIREFNRFIWAISGAAAVLVLVSTIGLYIFLKQGPNIEIAVKTPDFKLPPVGVNAVPSSKESVPPQIVNVHHHRIKRQPDLQESMTATNLHLPTIVVPSISESIPAAGDMSQLIAASDPDTLSAPIPKKDVTRIEMQTANPNIRIIWFVDKKPNAPPVGVLSDGEETKF